MHDEARFEHRLARSLEAYAGPRRAIDAPAIARAAARAEAGSSLVDRVAGGLGLASGGQRARRMAFMAIALITVVSIGALAIGSGLLRLQPAPTSPVVAPPSAQPIPTAQTPAAANWTAAGAMLGRRQSHTATLLHDGQVLIAGGTNGSKGLATAELYDPATGT